MSILYNVQKYLVVILRLSNILNITTKYFLNVHNVLINTYITMKTRTIIFLIRKVDYLMSELNLFNSKSNLELEALVTMYTKTFDILKLIIQNNWLTTDVKLLRQELNDFQYNLYDREENKLIRKFFEKHYNFYYN